jgi:hypothetical protein
MRWLAWLMFLPAVLLAATSRAAPEYSIKAGYILLFTRYVQWPASAFATPRAPIVVCVVGPDPFGSVLDETLDGQLSQNRPLSVRRVSTANAAEQCHVAFIGRASDQPAGEQTGQWFDTLADHPVLTIAETPGGLEQGAMLCFVNETESGAARIRFEASLPAMHRAGLTASSQMLVAARKVHREPPGI